MAEYMPLYLVNYVIPSELYTIPEPPINKSIIAIIRCPDCRRDVSLTSRVHRVDRRGNVNPSFVCPKCRFHAFVRLEDWTVRAQLLDRPIPIDNNIKMFLHCRTCIEEIRRENIECSPQNYARYSFGYTKLGLQVWCNRHNINILHVDFQGIKHPGNFHAKGARNT